MTTTDTPTTRRLTLAQTDVEVARALKATIQYMDVSRETFCGEGPLLLIQDREGLLYFDEGPCVKERRFEPFTNLAQAWHYLMRKIMDVADGTRWSNFLLNLGSILDEQKAATYICRVFLELIHPDSPRIEVVE